jgi:hypothetical protein
MARDEGWALSESSLYFQGKGSVQDAARKITRRLNELGIPYVVVGGIALFHHGFRRYTDDVDLLVTPDGLRELHEKLEGLGYLPPFKGSKQLRDVENGVKIEFLVTGEYPGDGKPKPIAFPDPAHVATGTGEFRYISLPALLELKLASGMTGRGRRKDLSDVQEVIKVLKLERSYAERLDAYVRAQFLELWDDAQGAD